MSAAILDAIKTWLYADTGGSGIHTAVAGRIYHLEGPTNPTLPLVVYGLQGAEVMFGFNDAAQETYALECTIWANGDTAGAANALGIDVKLRARLDKAILSPTGYDRITIRLAQPGIAALDGETVAVTSVYRIQGTRT
jgi:hypothetical protein